MIDGTAVTGFRLAKIVDSDINNIRLNCPAVTANGGIEYLRTRRSKLRDSMIIGSATQAQPSLIMTDAQQLELDSVHMTAVPSGVNVAAIIAGTATSITASRSKFGHATGAVAGIGLSTTSGLFTYIGLDRCDFTEAVTPVSSASIAAGAAYDIHNNRGLDTLVQGTATIPSGSTFVVVTHGADIDARSLSQILVTPQGLGLAANFWISNFTASTFRINTNVDPGAATAVFTWQIDTGSKT
jgi:hypothetical protein